MFDGGAKKIYYSTAPLVSCKLKVDSGVGDKESSGQGTALEEVVLYIFNYVELIKSTLWIYSKRAG